MELLFDVSDGVSSPPAFSLTFEPEAMSLQCIGDMVTITVQAIMARKPKFWSGQKYRDFYPLLFSLHGVLFMPSRFQGNEGAGATLNSTERFPLAFLDEEEQYINLSFHCSRSYIQCIEEGRGSGSSSILALGISLWTTIKLTPVTDAVKQDNWKQIKSRQAQINVSQSHWIDMLSSIEYPKRRYIELPVLKPQDAPDALREAIEHLNEAHALFAKDRYREAVQRCRQARDALLGQEKPTWAEKTLSPVIGDNKAKTIDEGIKALINMGNVASHGNNIEVDREIASYVIGSLTLILDYIYRKIK